MKEIMKSDCELMRPASIHYSVGLTVQYRRQKQDVTAQSIYYRRLNPFTCEGVPLASIRANAFFFVNVI